MKNELKTLYKKSPKLALQVARVLGYKLVTADSVPYDELPPEIIKTLKAIGWEDSDLAFIRELMPPGSYFVKYNSNKSVALTPENLKILLKNPQFKNLLASKDTFGITFKNR